MVDWHRTAADNIPIFYHSGSIDSYGISRRDAHAAPAQGEMIAGEKHAGRIEGGQLEVQRETASETMLGAVGDGNPVKGTHFDMYGFSQSQTTHQRTWSLLRLVKQRPHTAGSFLY